MKEDQASWGTYPGVNYTHYNGNSPRPKLSDDDDPDFTDQPNKKKKYTYRKEVQRSYRARVKNKKADVETALQGTKVELEALIASNRYLQDNQQALELLNIEGAHLSNTLLNMQAQTDLTKNINALPSANLFEVANTMLNFLFTGGETFPDEHLKFYMTLPAPVLVKSEANFINRLDSLMAEVRQ
jgi:hypothetical protein